MKLALAKKVPTALKMQKKNKTAPIPVQELIEKRKADRRGKMNHPWNAKSF